MTPRTDLQAEGDRDLRAGLLADHTVTSAIERFAEKGLGQGARRHLLATATRLTAEMAPDIHGIIDGCRTTLGVDGPLEIYVYPEPRFNAAAVKPEKGRLLLMVSSALLEGFEPDELRFVAGHEVGHYLFDHHAIPTGALLGGQVKLTPQLALQLFAWQRYAEISADRAGLVCAGGLDPAARGLFKLASGLKGDRVRVSISEFLAQVGDLRQEAEMQDVEVQARRGDWFATHPFSPLRLKAAELCAASEVMTDGGTPRATLESEVQDLMTLMDPSYLTAKTDTAETMRRLLFAGGVAVACAADGTAAPEAIAELERLLGPGALPPQLKPSVILADLPSRIGRVRARVPPLRRAQVLRDLCVIARADGHVSVAEIDVIRDIAVRVEVDLELVSCVLDRTSDGCGSSALP
jgi:Zn-dependent protease with chaperone function